jgi:uncharacterized protein (TIGR03435 family)
MLKKFLLKISAGHPIAFRRAPEAMYTLQSAIFRDLRAVWLCAFVVTALNAPVVQAQSADLPKFEVASIKPAAPDARGMFIRPSPGGRLEITNMPVKEMMVIAWKVQPFQISGGPPWFDTARYDIVAKAESKPKDGDLPLMLQSLLAERFHLELHKETKELPVYALVMAKSDGKLGPGLTPAKEGACTPFDPSKPPAQRAPGQPFALGCGNLQMGFRNMKAVAIPIANILPMFARLLGRTVIDKTGLTGNFDINLEWTPDESQAMQPPPDAPKPPPSDNLGPSLFTALQEQLGLKLLSQKGPITVLVIDRVEKPTEN